LRAFDDRHHNGRSTDNGRSATQQALDTTTVERLITGARYHNSQFADNARSTDNRRSIPSLKQV